MNNIQEKETKRTLENQQEKKKRKKKQNRASVRPLAIWVLSQQLLDRFSQREGQQGSRWLRGQSVLFGFDYVFTRHIEFISFDVKSVMFWEKKLFACSSDVNTGRMVGGSLLMLRSDCNLCGIFGTTWNCS